MSSYQVRTPGNPDYNGKVYGIPFANGRAFVSKDTLDPRLKWTVEQIIHSMRDDFGYDVIELAPPANEPIEPPANTTPIPEKTVRAEAAQGVPGAENVPPAVDEKPKRSAKAAQGAEVTKAAKE